MIKKISIADLHPGMYIHDLNIGWLSHPFLNNRFHVKSEHQIGKVKALGVKEIYIDTAKGDDIASAVPQMQVEQQLQHQLDEVSTIVQPPQRRIMMPEEILQAEDIRSDAHHTIREILQDVRMGKQVDLERTNKMVSKLAGSVLRNSDALLSLDLIRHRDHYTFEHSVSVAVLLIAFGNELGLSSDEIHKLGVGGMLHDIGKTRIPDEILNKPGKLTDREFLTMQKHAEYGSSILDGFSDISKESIMIASQHHERLDGTGYPNNLHGDQISLFGQMAAIADVYDAIVSDRIYHKGQPPSAVLKKMLEWSKHHLNEELVKKFIHTVGIYPVGTLVRMENNHLGVVIERGEKGLLHPVIRCIYDANKKAYIQPYTLDLSNQIDDTHSHRIVSYEDPQTWGLRPMRYVTAA